MNIFRAIVFGIALWTLLFAEQTIAIFGFELIKPNTLYYIIHIILLILFTFFTALSYFWSKDMNSGFTHGIILGLVFIIVIILFDIFLTIPLMINNLNYLYRIDRIISYFLIIILSSLIGLIRN